MGRLYETAVNPASSATITRFLIDGDAMVAEFNSSGVMLRRYVHGAMAGSDDPIAWYEGASMANGSVRYLYANHQGSLILAADAAGGSASQFKYDEYGNAKMASGIAGCTGSTSPSLTCGGRFLYTGQMLVPELAMYYYKARVYSSALGRFLQVDPIGYEDQANLYAYGQNDPVNGFDPTGTVWGKVARGLLKIVTSKGDIRKAGRETLAEIGQAAAEIADGDLTVDDAAAVFDLVSPVSTKEVKTGVDAVRRVGNLPKPPTGKGSVPREQRDSKRTFSDSERAAKRDEQGGQCATGCGTKIDENNSAGHHTTRHADGGQTNSANHNEVCIDCHKKLHSRDIEQ